MSDEMHPDKIEVVYNASDFRALYRACRKCKRNALILLLIVPAVLGYLFYDGVHLLDFLIEALPYFLIMLITVLAVYFLTSLNIVRVRRKNGWNVPMSVRLTNEGISTEHPSQSSLFYWRRLRDVVLRGNWLFLFTTPSCAIILPRRCFANDEQFSTWAEHARSLWQHAKVTVE